MMNVDVQSYRSRLAGGENPKGQIRGLQWFGGKAERYKWILGHLPDARRRQMYVEPFAGMVSVLLNREPVDVEIVNDANRRLVNFWRVIRNHPIEIERLINHTPWAKDEMVDCLETIDEGSEIEQARKFIVCVSQSIMKTDANLRKTNWFWHTRKGMSTTMLRGKDQIFNLASRLLNVQIENIDAIEFIDRAYKKAAVGHRDVHEVVIYIDPPYRTADIANYACNVDFESLDEVLKRTPRNARVAISGYGNDYDFLGWRRAERLEYSTAGTSIQQRVEVLWMNYDTETLPIFGS